MKYIPCDYCEDAIPAGKHYYSVEDQNLCSLTCLTEWADGSVKYRLTEEECTEEDVE